MSLGASVNLLGHAADLEQLGRVLEGAVSRPVGHRQLEVVVLALCAVDPVEIVGVLPVLERVIDDVARLLVEPDGRQETVHAIRCRRIEIDPGLLVSDPVRELAGAEGDALARQLGETDGKCRARRRAQEDERAVHVGRLHVAWAQNLPDALLDGRLGQMGGHHAIPVGADHGGLEAHGHRELGNDDAKERQHEHHGQEGKAAIIAHGVVTGSEIRSGGCSTARAPRAMVSVTSIATGSAFSLSASQRSVHARSDSLR